MAATDVLRLGGVQLLCQLCFRAVITSSAWFIAAKTKSNVWISTDDFNIEIGAR